MNLYYSVVFIALITISALSTPANADVTLLEDDDYSVNLYGYLSVNYFSNSNQDIHEITDGWSRVGIDLRTDLTKDWQAEAVLEWGLSIVDNTTSLALQAGDGLRPQNSGDDIFWNRQGYIGFNHKKWGNIRFGKQWSVYYDVVGVLDHYSHLSAYSGGAYNLADGGISGVGRADTAISYRNQLGSVTFGIQFQSQSEKVSAPIDTDGLLILSDNTQTIDVAEVGNTFGVSAIYQKYKWSAGVAYNQMEIERLVTNIPADDDKILALSLVYGGLESPGIFSAILLTQAENHELDNLGNIFDSKSIEITAGFRFENNLSLYASYQQLKEDDSEYAGEYELSGVLMGIRYQWSARVSLYLEGQLDSSKNFSGSEIENDIILLGAKFNL